MYEHLHRQLKRDVPFIRESWRNAIAGRVHYRLTGRPVHRLDCTGCGGNFEADPGPVLYDKVWARIADRRERLCHQCVCKRINLHVFHHVKNVPWNTDFMNPYVFTVLGPTGRCWWRGPNAFRLVNYGRYVYDEAAVVRLTARDEAPLVGGD